MKTKSLNNLSCNFGLFRILLETQGTNVSSLDVSFCRRLLMFNPREQAMITQYKQLQREWDKRCDELLNGCDESVWECILVIASDADANILDDLDEELCRMERQLPDAYTYPGDQPLI